MQCFVHNKYPRNMATQLRGLRDRLGYQILRLSNFDLTPYPTSSKIWRRVKLRDVHCHGISFRGSEDP